MSAVTCCYMIKMYLVRTTIKQKMSNTKQPIIEYTEILSGIWSIQLKQDYIEQTQYKNDRYIIKISMPCDPDTNNNLITVEVALYFNKDFKYKGWDRIETVKNKFNLISLIENNKHKVEQIIKLSIQGGLTI